MDLPYELSEQIISYLAPQDLISMCLVHSTHLKCARKYLHREVSAPLSLAGIQRFLEISRDPALSPFVRTFRYPTRAAILVKGVGGDRPGLPSDQTPTWGDASTDIVLREEIPEEYLELVKANNRECQEQRRLLFSREHEEILREAVRNLPNLTGLNLQLGCFKVTKALQPLVKRAWCNQFNGISEEGNCVLYPRVNLELNFMIRVYNILSEILSYPRIPVNTLCLEGIGTLPRYRPVSLESGKQLQLEQALKDTRTLRLQFDPIMDYTPGLMPRRNFFFPPKEFLEALTGLQRLSIVVTHPNQQTSLFNLRSPFHSDDYKPHPLALVHTFELEGVRMYAHGLLRACKNFRKALKFLVLRRICLYGGRGWKGVMEGLKETEQTSPRLEGCEIEDVYERVRDRDMRKLPPECTQKMVDYLLGRDNQEPVFD